MPVVRLRTGPSSLVCAELLFMWFLKFLMVVEYFLALSNASASMEQSYRRDSVQKIWFRFLNKKWWPESLARRVSEQRGKPKNVY